MPDYTVISSSISFNEVQVMWEEYQQGCEREDREIEARIQADAELREDKRKYPLFFIKEGIV